MVVLSRLMEINISKHRLVPFGLFNWRHWNNIVFSNYRRRLAGYSDNGSRYCQWLINLDIARDAYSNALASVYLSNKDRCRHVTYFDVGYGGRNEFDRFYDNWWRRYYLVGSTLYTTGWIYNSSSL